MLFSLLFQWFLIFTCTQYQLLILHYRKQFLNPNSPLWCSRLFSKQQLYSSYFSKLIQCNIDKWKINFLSFITCSSKDSLISFLSYSPIPSLMNMNDRNQYEVSHFCFLFRLSPFYLLHYFFVLCSPSIY